MILDISFLVSKLNYILKNHKKYKSKIVLYVLGASELLNDSVLYEKISPQLIEILFYINNDLNDVNIEKFYNLDKRKQVFIVGYNDLFGYNGFDTLSEENIEKKIDEMIKNDKKLLDKLIDDEHSINISNNNTCNYDHIYLLINQLFNFIDCDGNGYITAIDVINILNMCHKYPLIFEFNFINLVVELLLVYTKIDFINFYKFFIGYDKL